jgi:hypothetical protein
VTPAQEREMHDLAVTLETLTRGTGWEASRYMHVGLTMEKLAEYCAVCDCQNKSKGEKGQP